MKWMSIGGIILFTWLLFNRYNQYEAATNYTGKSITYTEPVVEKVKNNIIPQMLVCTYALAYAVFGTVYFFKKSEKTDNK